MGYVAHDAVLVTTETYRAGGLPDMDAFRAEMPPEFRQLVIGPVETAINGTVCYAFLPDGSKEGWGHSDQGDLWRERFKALFQFAYDDGSSPDDVIEVRFGADYGYENEPRVAAIWPPRERLTPPGVTGSVDERPGGAQ